ncbi:hypothetical protein OIO90_003135 [Microbotryomycetes sp. JL221]|nr:hypothetical protein OIO90_003135 [Microbotryomycetes sp. JL221]
MSSVPRLAKPVVSALAWFGGSWLALLAACAVPSVQRSLIYLHQLRFPFGTDFDVPEMVGYAPGKVRNFYLTTTDGEQIGVWHVLPNSVYDNWIKNASSNNDRPWDEGSLTPPDSLFNEALRDFPVVLYQHGNAATRAHSNRVRVGRHVSNDEHNFVIYDYRGFGDSTGTPTEQGLITDARTVWDFLVTTHKIEPNRITVCGQSLGTGVSAALVGHLETLDPPVRPHGLILVAPFSSLGALLETYRLFNVLPLMAPLKPIPWLLNALITRMLKTRFDTQSLIRTIRCPILILHAQDDPVIPFSHSQTLAQHLLDEVLPVSTSQPLDDDNNYNNISNEIEITTNMLQLSKKHDLIQHQRLGQWGTVTTFERSRGFGVVTWAESKRGAHNEIGTTEMSLKLIHDVLYAPRTT